MGHNADLFQTDLDLLMLGRRIDRMIDAMAIKAAIELDSRAEHARRSIGQRFRRAREAFEGVNHGNQ